VEIDARLQALAAQELQGRGNITMLLVDILKNKNTLQPLVVQTIEELRQSNQGWQFKLVANLPYHIATPLISNLLLIAAPPERMVITIQKELADRLLATPSTKAYGALSVWMQGFCDIELLRVLSPTVFWPRPKVDSAIVLVKPHLDRLAARTDLLEFHHFVRSVFLLRRKLLRGVLTSLFKEQLGKRGIDEVMSSLALQPQARAEELSVEQLDRLFQALQKRLKDRNGGF
jgi:16S rRNA (adenine1518-N6/adenine1519-N6)-dimethyltransferase